MIIPALRTLPAIAQSQNRHSFLDCPGPPKMKRQCDVASLKGGKNYVKQGNHGHIHFKIHKQLCPKISLILNMASCGSTLVGGLSRIIWVRTLYFLVSSLMKAAPTVGLGMFRVFGDFRLNSRVKEHARKIYEYFPEVKNHIFGD